MPLPAPDPGVLHPIAGQRRVLFLRALVHGAYTNHAVVAGNPALVVRSPFSEEDVERLLCAASWNWPIELVTDHSRTIMTGTPAELDRIAAEHGLWGR